MQQRTKAMTVLWRSDAHGNGYQNESHGKTIGVNTRVRQAAPDR